MNNSYLTVSQINHYLKLKLDNDENLQHVLLKGEISNFKNHSAGHLYFTIKDETSRINAVMFSFNTRTLKFVPKDGMKVLVRGKINVYEPNGGYQIYVDTMENDGLGNLYQAYEELKIKLNKEGLFNQDHKLPIPKFPRKIGIITAPTGAAVKDIISTIKRRYPICETILFPTLVQGMGAKENIVKQIKEANTYDLDVIILGRGGGSIEDLWAFNEEIVAHAIYESAIPIISGVGHEIDFTISDFVSDLRAPTPTGAAEMAVPNIIDVRNYINQLLLRTNKNINNIITIKRNIIENIKNNYVLKNPLSIYEIKYEKVNNYMDKINNYITNIIKNNIHKYTEIRNSYILNNPTKLFDKYIKEYDLLINKLELLNPLAVLNKGYSIVSINNHSVRDLNKIKINDLIDIKLNKGNIKAKVEEINNEK